MSDGSGIQDVGIQDIQDVTDPDHVNRELSKKDVENIHFFLAKYLPDAAGPIVSHKYCLYTSTADEKFIIDFLPGHSDKVVVACGFSGHGFKFASAVGEILADLAVDGKTDAPIGFLNISRSSLQKQ